MKSLFSVQKSTRTRFDFSCAIRLLRCFNVAAICALAVWHAYAFYLNQAIARLPQWPAIEFKLQENQTVMSNTDRDTL